MSIYHYPLRFTFKITTLANDFVARDALGTPIFYAREKLLALRDQIKIYRDESKNELLYELISNKIIDFQQTFTITNTEGRTIGKVRRKSLRSLWKSTFKLMDAEDNHDFTIEEKNPFVKFWDSLFDGIPILGGLSGYILNPTYHLHDHNGQVLYEIRKEPSFFGRKFMVNKLTSLPIDEERLVLSIALMVLVERYRG